MYTDKRFYERMITSEKSTSQIGEKLLIFFINFFH